MVQFYLAMIRLKLYLGVGHHQMMNLMQFFLVCYEV